MMTRRALGVIVIFLDFVFENEELRVTNEECWTSFFSLIPLCSPFEKGGEIKIFFQA